MIEHDVFVSYHGSDRAATEHVVRYLRERGLKVFFDRWYLAPGQPWPETLERVLATCHSVIVCIGPDARGSWQEREIYVALACQNKQPGFPVMPVLLPGADSAFGFLGHNTRVDLRSSLGDARGLDILSGRPTYAA